MQGEIHAELDRHRFARQHVPNAGRKKQKRHPACTTASGCHQRKEGVPYKRWGSDLAYDAFYAKMKEWGKYQIVGSPEEADLIIELAYRVEHEGTRVWSSTNTYNGTTQVHSAQIVDPQLFLTIYDAKSKDSLWSTIDHRRLARREKNREKETINSAERLVEELRGRSDVTP